MFVNKRDKGEKRNTEIYAFFFYFFFLAKDGPRVKRMAPFGFGKFPMAVVFYRAQVFAEHSHSQQGLLRSRHRMFGVFFVLWNEQI